MTESGSLVETVRIITAIMWIPVRCYQEDVSMKVVKLDPKLYNIVDKVVGEKLDSEVDYCFLTMKYL